MRIATICLLTSLLSLSGCGFEEILGPRDKPDLQVVPWTSVQVKYWIRIGENRTKERNIVIDNEATLKGLQKSLNVKEIGGASFPYEGQLLIKRGDGTVWSGRVVLESCIGLTKASNKCYSYIVELSDFGFHKSLRNICLKHEKRINSHATLRNIKILQNHSIKSYDILVDKESVKKSVPIQKEPSP